MAKRGHQESDEATDTKPQFGHRQNPSVDDVEMGEFEDPWEDDLEEDEEIIEGDDVEEDEDEGILPLPRR
jgi:ribosome assembly protein RRB1